MAGSGRDWRAALNGWRVASARRRAVWSAHGNGRSTTIVGRNRGRSQRDCNRNRKAQCLLARASLGREAAGLIRDSVCTRRSSVRRRLEDRLSSSIESKVKPVTCNDPVFGQTLITGSDPMVVRIGTREQPTSVDPRSILLPARAP
jgi:hypothetical protein